MSDESSSLSLHELVLKEGRYYVQANDPEQIQYGCHDCIDELRDDSGVFVETGRVDPVEILKWVGRHEAQYHAPKDLNVQTHLVQIMLSYAQQHEDDPEAGSTGTCVKCGLQITYYADVKDWLHDAPGANSRHHKAEFGGPS